MLFSSENSWTWQKEWISESIKKKMQVPGDYIWCDTILLSSKTSETKEHIVYAYINSRTVLLKKKKEVTKQQTQI